MEPTYSMTFTQVKGFRVLCSSYNGMSISGKASSLDMYRKDRATLMKRRETKGDNIINGRLVNFCLRLKVRRNHAYYTLYICRLRYERMSLLFHNTDTPSLLYLHCFYTSQPLCRTTP